MPITVHLIFNSHIDPVWLWPWTAGVDEILATCRSACNRLDAHPDLIFSRGEAWAYRMVEWLDPELFTRIRRHVEAGRWEIVGGWWIQPDCNQPSGWAMKKQIELGRNYFQKTFGASPRVAYNVDSFGHAATLPGYIHEAGQRYYVMMRPQEHEMPLPARLFRWRGYEGSPEIVTFRIARSYGSGGAVSREGFIGHVRAAATELPEGIEHTMCFLGVGDHGGGPTEHLIDICRRHATALDGLRLVFSSPRRFFEAVQPQVERLPLVTGELQMHAIGCYSVHRGIKTALRRAEHGLAQAQIAQRMAPLPAQDAASLVVAWERVAFNHFHDTLGGTCIPSAYPQMEAQLGQAMAIADDAIHLSLRQKIQALPDDPCQRVVLFNASDEPYEGYTEFDPWLKPWTQEHQLMDETNQAIACQAVEGEPVMHGIPPHLVCRVTAAPGQIRVLRISRHPPTEPRCAASGRVTGGEGVIRNEANVAVDIVNRRLSLGGIQLPLPRLALLSDPTDTWSHGVDRYTEGPAVCACWNDPATIETGPLRAAMIQTGMIGASPLRWEWRLYAGEPYVELIMRIEWREEQQLLKLIVVAPGVLEGRTDGILGGHLDRPNNGKELPCRDFTLLRVRDADPLGIVSPDSYALDATASRVRLTLLRSPIMAHHVPHAGAAPRRQFADRGEHTFRLRFLAGRNLTPQVLDRQAMMLQRPLVYASVTRGMPSHFIAEH